MTRHLLVTNDFPPKIGGIQSYLWELWRRLPPSDVVVLTTPYRGSASFDAGQEFEIVRTREPVLVPSPMLINKVRGLARQVGAKVVVLDPAVPLGIIGPRLGIPYATVLHGAEVTVPARLPVVRRSLARVLRESSLVISAGGYPHAEARRLVTELPPVVEVPPGVDTSYFVPLDAQARVAARARLGLPERAPLVVSVSRLVPRKGMDVLIDAAAMLERTGRGGGLKVVIGGSGRDFGRLQRRIRATDAPVALLGRVAQPDMPDLYGCADVFALCCRNRWGGLEQEGFGIVLLEAAAAGIPAVAGNSGGSAEAVLDGTTGFVVSRPSDTEAVASALERLLRDPEMARKQGLAARERAESEFGYDHLAGRLMSSLESFAG